MNTDRYRQLKRLIEQAIDLPLNERAAFIAESRADDPDLGRAALTEGLQLTPPGIVYPRLELADDE